MNKKIYIGIDGGGTKTKALIENEEGKLIGEGIGGPSNIRLSVDEAWKSIYDSIEKALAGTGISLEDKEYDFYIGLGLAGVSMVKAKEDFLSRKHPFAKLVLESDAHIACLGAHDGKDGAIMSVGTGLIGYMIADNKAYRVGGWGFPHSDTASGAWFGMEAIRLLFSSIDGAIESSPMLESIYNKFDNNLSDLVQWANSTNSSGFGTIAPFVMDNIENNDKYSVELAKKASLEIDKMVKALLANSDKKVDCLFMGGISRYILKYINVENAGLADPNNTAAKGAIYFIRRSV